MEHDIDFMMAIETGGMFDRLVENGFDELAGLIHLKGQPARSTRRVMKRINEEWEYPLSYLQMQTPGLRIFASIAYGAIKTAHLRIFGDPECSISRYRVWRYRSI